MPYSCEEWAETFGITYPILDDSDYSLVELFGLYYIPHNVIIDHEMTIRHSNYEFDETGIIQTIEELLAETNGGD